MCSERKDQIFLYAADQLEPGESEDVRRHLATGCPICAGTLAEAEAILAQIASAVEPVEPSSQIREMLMSRVTEASGVVASATTKMRLVGTEGSNLQSQISNRRSAYWFIGLLSAAASVAITSAIFVSIVRKERARPAQLQMVSMNSETQPAAHGVVAWDRDHGQWHVAVFNLAPPPTGREFELWFIPPGGKPIASKTFTVDASGNATIIVPLPANIGPIAVAAITDEPVGGVAQPTGKIQLAGKVTENSKS